MQYRSQAVHSQVCRIQALSESNLSHFLLLCDAQLPKMWQQLMYHAAAACVKLGLQQLENLLQLAAALPAVAHQKLGNTWCQHPPASSHTTSRECAALTSRSRYLTATLLQTTTLLSRTTPCQPAPSLHPSTKQLRVRRCVSLCVTVYCCVLLVF